MNKLEYFNKLKWHAHPAIKLLAHHQAIIFFNNGYGASVITGKMFYTDEKHPYELAVLKKDKKGISHICYDTHLTDDVLGYLTAEDVDRLLREIEKLPKEDE